MWQKFWQSNHYWSNCDKSSKLLSEQCSIWNCSLSLPFTYYNNLKRVFKNESLKLSNTVWHKNFDNNKFRSEYSSATLITPIWELLKKIFLIYSINMYQLEKDMFTPMKPLLWPKSFTKQLWKCLDLKNKFFKDRIENNQENFKLQRNFCKKLLRTTKKLY